MMERHVWETGHLKQEPTSLGNRAVGHPIKGFTLGVSAFRSALGTQNISLGLPWVVEHYCSEAHLVSVVQCKNNLLFATTVPFPLWIFNKQNRFPDEDTLVNNVLRESLQPQESPG